MSQEVERLGGRPTDYRPEYCQQVQDVMRAGFSLTAFAGSIGVSRGTLNNWMAAHPEFLEAVNCAKAARLLHWEEAAINVAKGLGGPGSATIVVFGLRNMAPDEYADKQQVEHSGPNGAPIETNSQDLREAIAQLSEEQREQLRSISEALSSRPRSDPE